MNDTPHNAFNGVEYRGYNVLFLNLARAEHKYETSAWASFLDWKKHGFTVKKGEKGVHCRTFVTGDKIAGDKKKSHTGVAIRYFVLFNRAQVEETKEKQCPRCHEILGEYPALSRRDNRTKICSQCGTLEALEDWQKREATV